MVEILGCIGAGIVQHSPAAGGTQQQGGRGWRGSTRSRSSSPAQAPTGEKLLRAPPCQPTGAWLSCSRPPNSSTNARVVWQPQGTSSAVQRTSSSMQASVSCSGTS